MRRCRQTAWRDRGAALIVVLWTVVLLSIILANFAFLVRTHTRLTANYRDAALLSNIASAGVERAIAAVTNDSEPADTLLELWAASEDEFKEVTVGEGTFSLVRFEQKEESIRSVNGLEDEAAKINLRVATNEMLNSLPGMTPELTAALLDWQDADSDQQRLGAEAEYYASLDDPYPCRNAALDSLEELFLVKGFDASILYGEDWNLNGQLDQNERDGENSLPPDDQNDVLNRGLLPYVTLWSEDANKSIEGAARVDINSANEQELKNKISGLTDDEAKAIFEHRNKNKFEQVGQLLLVEEVKEEQKDQNTEQQNKPNGELQEEPNQNQSQNQDDKNSGGTGKKIFTKDRLKQIIDYCAISGDSLKAGRVNLNTAPVEVLKAIPGLNNTTAQAIVQARETEQKKFKNIAELLDIPGVSDDNFIKASEWVTVKSDQFRVRSEARIEGVTMRKRVVAVIDRSGNTVKIRYWNEQ